MTAADPTRIEVDAYLPYQPGAVWEALTDPELLAEWLMPNDFLPVVGHRFRLHAKAIPATGFSGTIACEVLRLVPERLLHISWCDADPAAGFATTVTWRLEPEGHGTRLFVVHEGFDPDHPAHQLARRIMGGGWGGHVLRRLRETLARTGHPATFGRPTPRPNRSTVSTAADRFRVAADGFLARVEAIAPDQWDAPTPCPAWTVRDVVRHVVNEQRRTLATVHGREPEPLHGVDVAAMGVLPELAPDADLAAAWRTVAAGLTAAIDDPGCRTARLPSPTGQVPFTDLLDILPEDVLIHTWDLARATGGDERLDPAVVAHVFEHLRPLDEVLRHPWAFGPAVPPSPTADEQTRFLNFVGRTP